MDKLIEKFDMVVKIIDVDHVDGHKLKNVNVIVYEEQCANITKEIAIGFSEWMRKEINQDRLRHYDPAENGKWAYWKIGGGGYADQLTTSELFDLYIKSL